MQRASVVKGKSRRFLTEYFILTNESLKDIFAMPFMQNQFKNRVVKKLQIGLSKVVTLTANHLRKVKTKVNLVTTLEERRN